MVTYNKKPDDREIKKAIEEVDKKFNKVELKGSVKLEKSKRNGFLDFIFLNDVKTVIQHVLFEDVIPSIKDTVLDVVIDGASMLLNGEPRSIKRYSNKNGNKTSIQYNKISEYNSYRSGSNRQRQSSDYDTCVLEYRQDAEEVITNMYMILDKWGSVSVADFCELVGVTGKYTDNNYGWYDLKDATINRARDGGYIIKLPKPEPLD